MVVPVNGETKNHPLRRGDKGDFTVTGQGVFQRPLFLEEKKHEEVEMKSEIPLNTPQYSTVEKKGYSKPLPAALATSNYWVPIIDPNSTVKNILAGTIIYSPDYRYSDRLFLGNFTLTDRLPDFNQLEEANKYFNQNRMKTLFPSSEKTLFKWKTSLPANRDAGNTVFVRQRWNIETSQVFIGNINLESALHALEIARLMKNYLVQNNLVSVDYEVPIIYYTPKDLDYHLKPFTVLDYRLSVLKAGKIYSDKTLRTEKYAEKKYQFLLHLTTQQIKEALFELIPLDNNPNVFETLAERLLYSGYISILEGLADKLECSLKSLIDLHCSIVGKKTSPLGWYHLLRCGYDLEAAELLKSQPNINFKELDKDKNSIMVLAIENNDFDLFEKIGTVVTQKKGLRDFKYDIINTAVTYNQSKYLEKLESELAELPKLKELPTTKIVAKGNLAMIQALNNADKMEKTAIEVAFEQKRFYAVIFLIEKNPRLLQQKIGPEKETPLFLAIKANHLELIEYMIRKGAYVDETRYDNHSSLTFTYKNVDSGKSPKTEMINLLLTQPDHQNSLSYALKNNVKELQELIFERHPNLIETVFEGKTAFAWAAERRDAPMVDFLLSKGAIAKTILPAANAINATPHLRPKNELTLRFLLENGLKLSALNSAIKPSPNAKALFIELLDYINTRRREKPFKTSFLSINFGKSQDDKLDASIQLKDVILGLVPVEHLANYKESLNTGRLEDLFKKLVQAFTTFELHDFKEGCTTRARRVFTNLTPS